ncbi:AI-2E family transporter [Frondihabitans australicus]|uniref:Putative PurR-regulated permease PerM n=1 Tax=Frondihabitans australicus TaxID=386892 RepID=A0A495IF92_9MICO|nr:AI-2E family transporter [Frondihabitans australicus]RKR73706.1 putative PurR-regulated permease PerM [Frondihabitans australicus]
MRIHGAFRLGLFGGLGVLAAVLIGTALGELSTILTYVGVALFLALGLDPVVAFLEARRVPRPAAVAIVMVAVLAAFVGVVFAIVPTIVSQTTDLVNNLATYLQSLTAQQFVDNLQSLVPKNVFNVQDALNTVIGFLTDPKNIVTIGGGVLAVGVAITNGVTGTIIVLILTLYFMASLKSMKSGLYQLVPKSSRSEFARLADAISASVGRYVIGQVALALLNGVLSFIVLSIVGAQLPAFFAFLAFIGALIPLVGTVGAAAVIVCAQVALLPLSPATWISIAVWYLIYMQVEAYVFSPRVMRQAVKVPGVIVIISALVGGTLLGVLGALIAVPVAAAVLLIVREVVIPRQNER